jgi:hypothetical protein
LKTKYEIIERECRDLQKLANKIAEPLQSKLDKIIAENELLKSQLNKAITENELLRKTLVCVL